MSTLTIDDIYLTAPEVAARHRKTVETLANERSRGDGLAWTKIGGKVLYPAAVVIEAENNGLTGFSWSRFEDAVRSCPDVTPGMANSIIAHCKRKLLK